MVGLRMTDCPRSARWFPGCCFERRYSYVVDRDAFNAWLAAADETDMMEAGKIARRLTNWIYRGDVCIRCGKRSEAP